MSDPASTGNGATDADGTGANTVERSVVDPNGALHVPPVYQRRDGVAVTVFGVLCAVLLASSSSPFSIGLIGRWSILAIAGLGFYLAFGIGGQFTFAQAAFVGVGAYTSAYMTQVHGLSFFPAMLVATVATAVVAAGLFALIRRTEAFYFAIATLAFAFLAVVVFRQWTSFAGSGGERNKLVGLSFFGDVFKGRSVAVFLVVMMIVFLVLTILVERSTVNRFATSVRELPIATPTFGIDDTMVRFSLFVAGSAFGGAAGALMAHRAGIVQPDLYDIPLAINLFLVLLFGGLRSAWGPILGAAFVVWAPEQLRFIGRYQDLIFGILLVLIMIFVPEGLVGIGTRIRGWFTSRGDGGGGSSSRPPVPRTGSDPDVGPGASSDDPPVSKAVT